MLSPQSFRSLMNQVRKGSEGAMSMLIQRFDGQIRYYVRREYGHLIKKSLYDSNDFVQEMWASVVRRRDALATIELPQQLKRWLMAIARNKIIDERRRETLKQGSEYIQKLPVEPNDVLGQLPSAEPTASQLIMEKDLRARIERGHAPRTKRLVALLVNGEKLQGVAMRLGISVKTARRIIKRLKSENPCESAGAFQKLSKVRVISTVDTPPRWSGSEGNR